MLVPLQQGVYCEHGDISRTCSVSRCRETAIQRPSVPKAKLGELVGGLVTEVVSAREEWDSLMVT